MIDTIFDIIARLFRRCDDNMNPIVVKEARQAVRGRFIFGALLLFLVFQLGALFIALVARANRNSLSLGAETCSILQFFLLCAVFVVIPVFAGFRFGQERSSDDAELLFISTITPTSIILGKYQANMGIIALFLCACLPFMALTYFLRGVDLPSILFGLLIILFYASLSVAAQLCVAAIPLKNTVRLVAWFFGLVFLVGCLPVCTGFLTEVVQHGLAIQIFVFGQYRESLALVIFFGLFAHGLFYQIARAAISSGTSNRAYGFRRFISVSWLLSLLVACWASTDPFFRDSVFVWFCVVSVVCFCLTITASCERDRIGHQVRRSIPATSLARIVAFLFFSGAAGGILWSCLVSLMTFLVLWLGSWLLPQIVQHANSETIQGLLFMFGRAGLIFLACSLLSIWLRRQVFGSTIPRNYIWLMALVLVGLISVVPYILDFLLFQSDSEVFLLFNPFVVLKDHKDLGMPVALAAVLLGLTLNRTWFFRQWREFIPLDLRKPDETPNWQTGSCSE